MERNLREPIEDDLSGRLAVGLPRAARILDVSRSFLALEVGRRRLRVRRLGRRLVVTVEELRRYLDEAHRQGES